MRMNLPKPTWCPLFSSIRNATMFADAPMGVMFPPTVDPISRPNRSRDTSRGLLPIDLPSDRTTGTSAVT